MFARAAVRRVDTRVDMRVDMRVDTRVDARVNSLQYLSLSGCHACAP